MNTDKEYSVRIEGYWSFTEAEMWPDGAPNHAEKPEAFLDHIETLSPGPYVEIFARRNRIGWDTWGNEALEHVHVVEASS